MKKEMHCGQIVIVGRSNVGKSTLLNKLVGQKISITSCKVQTTRHCILGIHTEGMYQAIYVDTPGFYIKQKQAISQLINKAASSAISNAALVIFVVEGIVWTLDDQEVINRLRNRKQPVILAINKVDNIKEKVNLLPHMKWLDNKMNFLSIVPVSAKTAFNVHVIATVVRKHLPKANHVFPEKCITNRSYSFIASEIIREKLIRFFREEIPYSVTVDIEYFQSNDQGGYDIDGVIFVERNNQKKIIIGNKGMRIKAISIAAGKEIQKIFKSQIKLKLWVKIKPNRPNDEKTLYTL